MARGRLSKAPSVGQGLLSRGSAPLGKGAYVTLGLLVAVGTFLAVGAWKLGLSVLPAPEDIIPRSALEVSAEGGAGPDDGERRILCECPTIADEAEQDYSAVYPKISTTTAEGNATLSCDTWTACQTPYRKCGEIEVCGKRVNCGGCSFPEACGGGSEHNKCGCLAQTCKDLDRDCGWAPDGCGGILYCGRKCEPWILDLASDTKPPEPKRPFRIGRFSNLAQYRNGGLKVTVADFDTKHFSHVIFNYATIDRDSLGVKAGQWNDPDVKEGYYAKGSWRLLAEACQLSGTVPMLAIGGWDFVNSDEGKKIFSVLLSDESARAKFVANVGEWMELYGYQGLEFDWQWPGQEQHDNFLKFLGDIRASFYKLKEKKGRNYWLSVRGPAAPGFADAVYTDKRALGNVVDWVAVMATGLHQFDKEKGVAHTGASAAIYDTPDQISVSSSIAHWKQSGLHSSKLVLEVGTFGIVWRLQSPSANTYGAPANGYAGKDGDPSVSYRELMAEFSGAKAVRDVFHAATSTVYAYKGDRWASYEDPRTVTMKVDFVVQQQLGGYMLTIDKDDAQQTLSIAASERTKPTHIELRKDAGPIMIVSSSPAKPCGTSQGTFMLTRAMKNKVDYAQRNNWTLTWSQAVLQPQQGHPFTLPSLFRKLLAAHHEVDWFLWTDSDAIFTDMLFQIPFKNYRWHNLVINGSKKCVYDEGKRVNGKVAWNCINTGVFLLRNSPWSLKLVDEWFDLTSPARAKENEELFSKALYGKPRGGAANDQSALLYLLQKDKDERGEKIYFEDTGMLHGLWQPSEEQYENYEAKAGPGHKWAENGIPPFVTHFAGCGICAENGASPDQDLCFKHMDRALNFADNQVLDNYGMKHSDLASPALIAAVQY